MKYNIIGDIHGLDSWKDLVSDQFINVFVGDYFSPYGYVPFERQRDNFLDIMDYKTKHQDKVVLLLGNHDEDHWHIVERYSRHDSAHLKDIKQLFEEFKDYFQLAYNIEGKALVTHAGVTPWWYENVTKRYCYNYDRIVADKDDESENPEEIHRKFYDMMYAESDTELHDIEWEKRNDAIIYSRTKMYRYDSEEKSYSELSYSVGEVCNTVNRLWNEGKYDCFDFRTNSDNFDGYGYSKTHGPLWVRDKTLITNNIFQFTDTKQFVGHTQHRMTVYLENVGFADCLQYEKESILYDTKTDKVYAFKGNESEMEDITEKFK